MREDKENLEAICQKLQAKEYRVTPQRQVILEVFWEHPGEHLSAEEVFYLVKEKQLEMGLATVYRTLDLLAELEILERLDFGEGKKRYEFRSALEIHQHHHLICLKCGEIFEFDEDLLETLEQEIATKSGFKILNHQLKFYGLCGPCFSKEQSQSLNSGQGGMPFAEPAE